jgi:hypothetical protein
LRWCFSWSIFSIFSRTTITKELHLRSTNEILGFFDTFFIFPCARRKFSFEVNLTTLREILLAGFAKLFPALNINKALAEHPEIEIVFVDSTHSRREVLPEGLVTIEDFVV